MQPFMVCFVERVLTRGRRGRRPYSGNPEAFIVVANVRGGQRAGRPTTCPFTQSLQTPAAYTYGRICMPRMPPVLLGGDANVYGMARSFYECYGVRSLVVCRRALPALAHSRLVRSPCRTRRSGRTTSLRPRCWAGGAVPGVPKISSPAPTTHRPCWPAMPTR